MESAGRVCAQDNQSPPLCTGQLAAMDADVLAAAFPPVPEEPVPAAAALDGGPLFTTIASNLEGGFAPFRFKRSMMELLLFAQLGIAIAAHEQDATPRSTANHSTVSSMRASPVPSSLGDAASGSGDSTASDVDEDVEALSLPPVSPAGALDLLNDQIFESLRQGGGDVLGTLTRTGGRGVDGLLTAGSLVGRASSRVVTGGATLFSQLGRLVPRRTDRAAQAAQAMGNGFLFGIERAGGAAATPSHAALAAMSPGKLAPEEEEVLRKKLADLDSVLQAELEDLKTQNVDIYLERFQEAMLVQSKLKELEEQVRLEEEEMRLQERILEIERNENLKYPEPDDARPALSAGDDDFSRQMREYGLTHVSSTNEVKQLRHDLLPPELDLDQFLLMDNPDAGSES
eukprot:m.179456 g.179456  ORF g.179456 m.179456 type:complete len:401 (-) comp10459_c1_seq7:166-1368(-)